MKNCGDLGGCYPPRPTSSTDNTLLNLNNNLHKILSLIHQLLNIKLSEPLHLILILIHVSLFRYNNLILCLLILHMVLYLSINFNFKKKLNRNTLETRAFWASLVIVSLPWMFMGEERYNVALWTSLWDAKM